MQILGSGSKNSKVKLFELMGIYLQRRDSYLQRRVNYMHKVSKLEEKRGPYLLMCTNPC